MFFKGGASDHAFGEAPAVILLKKGFHHSKTTKTCASQAADGQKTAPD
jgi:hypothetical protein